MQSKTSRVALLVAAVAIAVAAFVVLRPGDDDEGPATAEQASESQAQGGEAPADGDEGGEAERQRPRPKPEPEVTEIQLMNGDVVGGVEEIEVESGERIEFLVESDAPDEIHVHGYELTEQVGPGDPARFSFAADIEGIYEVEAHDLGHVVIAELRVTPS